MENKQLNNLADKTISDEELEKVAGGTKYLKCPYCGTMYPVGETCPKCKK